MIRPAAALLASLLAVQLNLAAPADGCGPDLASSGLPAGAAARLEAAKRAAAPHARHAWRDVPAIHDDGTLNAYIEIPVGDSRKWEFDIARNRREIDRVLPAALGGYPINYGFVPQTFSYDGDPFDVLVTGPALEGGALLRTIVVGLFCMEDEKGPDAKVVASPLDARGGPRHPLDDATRARVARFFAIYRDHEGAEGKYSRVGGWDDAEEGRRLVALTARFFREGR